jgi:hypothetical protein
MTARTYAAAQRASAAPVPLTPARAPLLQRGAPLLALSAAPFEPVRSNLLAAIPNAGQPMVDVLSRAAKEASRPLDSSLRRSLEGRLGHDFSRIRVHSGPASAAAADHLGARAYTLGRDIHLGAEALALTGRPRDHLLAHEAVHTAQQHSEIVTPHDRLTVSHPHDTAESEAKRLAAALETPPASGALALRDRMRAGACASIVTHVVAPQIQRDLTGKKAAIDGDFNLDLKTESHPGKKSGMNGTITFKASDKAPDSTSIRLLQIARTEDLAASKDLVWTGDEANRMKAMTAADKTKGVEEGYFVDLHYKDLKQRTAKDDAPVSPYYIDDAMQRGRPESKDGSKKGKTIKEASLGDYPGSGSKIRFSFETAAKDSNTGYVFATLTWGFTISDPAKGKVENEHATANDLQSTTFNAAVTAFDEFIQNPGSSKAPK